MIPQLILEEIMLGEKKEEDFYGRYNKADLEKELSELRKSNEEILLAYPAEDFVKKIDSAKKTSPVLQLTKSTYKVSVWKYCIAAVMLFALALPFAMHNLRTTSVQSNIRVKGNARQQIKLYKQNGNDAVVLKSGESARKNDLIQITYTSGSFNYGVIFSVDGNGNLTRHFPENSWQAAELEKTGNEVPLSFAYALDDAPDYECFVFVTSKDKFDLSALEKISRKEYNLDFLQKGSYLPKNCEHTVFILNKK